MESTAIAKVSKQKRRIAFVPNPSRTIEWFGAVNYPNLEKTLTRIKSLMADGSREDIDLLVSSYGGATSVGMSFYDTINTILKPNLVTIGSGDVDSSGIVVFLSGKKRFLTKNTTLLLHLGGRTLESDTRFSTAELENLLKENRLKDYQYACIVADATRGRYSPERILELMSRDTILTAEEAVNLGLAHGITR